MTRDEPDTEATRRLFLEWRGMTLELEQLGEGAPVLRVCNGADQIDFNLNAAECQMIVGFLKGCL